MRDNGRTDMPGGIALGRRRAGRAVRPLLIITGDDFGLSEANNAGIIQAHRAGILSCASLMVGGAACEQAVALAKRHRRLSVGLHLSFSDTRPVLPAMQVDRLVQPDGFFPPDERLLYPALRSAMGRRQIRAEIAAQFAAFHRLGLPCDHVNAHRNAHLHPQLAPMVFRAAAQWQVTSVRIPWDPERTPLWRNLAGILRAATLRLLAMSYGLQPPIRSIGRVWSVPELVRALSAEHHVGTEYYFHPVDSADHAFACDLPALLDTSVRRAAGRWTLGGYRSAMNEFALRRRR